MNSQMIYLDRELKSAVVTPTSGDYGSLAEARLAEVSQVLLSVASTETRLVVLNLCRVDGFGAAFLGRLASANEFLRARGKHLLLCTDHLAILKITGLCRFLPVFDDLQKAREYCRTYVANTVLPPASDGPIATVEGPAPTDAVPPSRLHINSATHGPIGPFNRGDRSDGRVTAYAQ